MPWGVSWAHIGLSDGVPWDVLGQQQMVKASVRRWQPRLVSAVTRDHKVEIAQTLDRHAVRARAEEEEALLELDWETMDDL